MKVQNKSPQKMEMGCLKEFGGGETIFCTFQILNHANGKPIQKGRRVNWAPKPVTTQYELSQNPVSV